MTTSHGTTPVLAELTEADKLALFREMQKQQKEAAEEKAAAKAGITIEELRAQRYEKIRNERYKKIAEAEGITFEEAIARAGTRRSSDGERKTLVSVSIPANLDRGKQLERIERSIRSLEAARQTLLSQES